MSKGIKFPAIPEVSGLDPSLARVIGPIKENIEMMNGTRVVTAASVPLVFFAGSHNSGASIPATPMRVVFSNRLANAGGYYNTTTGRFTCPTAGVYQVNCVLLLDSASPSAEYRMAVLRNGGADLSTIMMKASGTVYQSLVLSEAIYCAANDVLEIVVWSPTSVGALWSDVFYNRLTICRVLTA